MLLPKIRKNREFSHITVTSLPAIVCALRALFSEFFLAERTKIKHHHQNERNNPPAPRF
jgi:hypothetical protein